MSSPADARLIPSHALDFSPLTLEAILHLVDPGYSLPVAPSRCQESRTVNNMQAAVIHLIADAAVSVWVIVSWSSGLIRGTSANLLDMNPDRRLEQRMRCERNEQLRNQSS